MPTIACGHFIDGRERLDGRSFDVVAPETGAVFATAARGTAETAAAGVQAAAAALDGWKGLPPSEREKPLLAAAELLDAACDAPASHPHGLIIEALIEESGSTAGKAGFEARYTAQLLRTYAGEARRLYGETFPNDKPNRMSMVIREPVGVVAVVAPYNAPLVLLAKMAILAVAAGNTVVAKPSEETPVVAVQFAKLLHEAGLPAGVFNVVTGYGKEVGQPLCEHPEVACLAFTGSTATGAALGSAAVRTMKRIQLELGGKNPLIVCADAARTENETANAAEQAVLGAFFHAGQICMASSRIIVERAAADKFIPELIRQTKQLKLGSCREPSTAYGPLINAAALDKVHRHTKSGLAAGGRLLCGGAVHKGLVYQPTLILLGEGQRECEAWTEESFGPLACVTVVESFEEAIRVANDTEYGLSAGVLTNDLVKAMRAVREVKAGSVHVGMHSFQSDALAPIGGVRMSGLGKSGGHYSMEHFTEQKWVSMALRSSPVPPPFAKAKL